jgi:flavin reductase (DIM6/NTAB) family NADH-FMN oxidoreductase RutF
MFYRPAEGHGLPHNPFNAIVTPRPIGWISTRSATHGDNLAPYSFFNAVAYTPPQVAFASTTIKDSLRNIRESRVFAVNIVSQQLMQAMNSSSAALAHGRDEFAASAVDKAQCQEIDCPMVANAPAVLECRLVQEIRLLGADNWLVHGEVVGIHLRDDCLHEGRFDVTRFRPVARLGYHDYSCVETVFELERPDKT